MKTGEVIVAKGKHQGKLGYCVALRGVGEWGEGFFDIHLMDGKTWKVEKHPVTLSQKEIRNTVIDVFEYNQYHRKNIINVLGEPGHVFRIQGKPFLISEC